MELLKIPHSMVYIKSIVCYEFRSYYSKDKVYMPSHQGIIRFFLLTNLNDKLISLIVS